MSTHAHPFPSAAPFGTAESEHHRSRTAAGRMAVNGDCQQDFQSIHDGFRPRILRYLARLTSQSEAEDLTQTVLLRVSEGLPHFRGESSLATWIYRIATNTALDHLRRAKNEQVDVPQRAINQTNDDHDSEQDVVPCDEQTPSVEAVAIRAEMNTCIRDFIERLPENYKALLVLSELEGFRNGEIAAVLGLSLDTVKIRLHRAREKLRKELASGCNFSRDAQGDLECERGRMAISRPVRTSPCKSR